MKRVEIKNILNSSQSADIAVASQATVYTKAFKIAFGEYFGLAYKAVSATGSPDVKIELELGVNDAPPSTEGAADTNYVEAENAADIETNLTTETWHIKSLSPVASGYARLKITGNASNAADTIVNAKLRKQADY